ncbi:hypothetical protein A2962_02050 [Candidatus Woesebacteria bacterium RIFCSPLOWO2_01_FULL_39_61]|uniref:Uncharacterized protein n=1 Tax=Candidatus Woesebacteria bacterium RIFCSPHIGHO2_02_FULL_39_13 TaxID=1802505 RepID=A0A1F7YYG4_9BACT|nr:MAG: hypothetical protein A3D01_04685 [Candidatus Woesebacteria bacterium RIFCSPHIGHO2_02_FULL_39_13]OGM67927.1 MAG: hypothetical protein A2962_02050 [Candidatus Woesebacteria bacterium RIFCSPLOWO2_01_FULL_39_61]
MNSFLSCFPLALSGTENLFTIRKLFLEAYSSNSFSWAGKEYPSSACSLVDTLANKIAFSILI